ncbi:trypsin-like cysteine/serine peptidase domain-containing protein [Syncephalis fuscata]|nr:trypsin-like cysteine/serine peptidase domain-containing protein [Syncephalis fuscata]
MVKPNLITTLTAIVIATLHMAKATPFNPVMQIAGGDSTTVAELSFVVRLLYNQDNVCSGSIIGDRWILTAAHCVVDGDEHEKTGITAIRDPSKYAINIGLNSDVNRNSIAPKNVYAHPKYTRTMVRYGIGLLELSRPLKFTHTIQPVKLIKNESKLSHLDQLLCTAYVRGKTPCRGDSGSPLLARVTGSNGAVGKRAAVAWLQAGVTSFTRDMLNHDPSICGAEGNVEFYARIDYFISWIAKTTGMPVGQFTAPLPKRLEAK